MTDETEYAANPPDGDAALDALLERHGDGYNRPPDIVPREEMWHAIRRADAPHIDVHGRRRWRMLAAAALLMGAGITIGAEVHSHLTSGGHAVAMVPSMTSEHLMAGSAGVNGDSGPVIGNDQRDAIPHVAAGLSTANGYGVGNTTENMSAQSTAYTLATVRHFTAVEALLTSYRDAPHDSRGDAQMSMWAQALLSQTRLLLDSPAASDPARRKLLQDLELVLVQMTQLAHTETPIDREMLDGAVRHSDVITRLRTAVPAGIETHL